MTSYGAITQDCSKRFESFCSRVEATALMSKGVSVGLSSFYELLMEKDLNSRQRGDYAKLLSRSEVTAVLVPRPGSGRTALPVNAESLGVWEAVKKGCSWSEVLALLSEEVAINLFLQGLLSAVIAGQELSGPVVPLAIKTINGTWRYSTPATDEVSYSALRHADRLPDLDFAGLVTRLYTFNHHGVFESTELVEAVNQATQFVSRESVSGYRKLADTPNVNHWTYFVREGEVPVRDAKRLDYKIYLSPTVRDLGKALSGLEAVLANTDAHTWKIGRGQFGITRPDKICLYFYSQDSARDAARLLGDRLCGIDAQGVPFTQRYVPNGLVSGGMDPPLDQGGDTSPQPMSWRLLVARKLAAALVVAKQHNHYPISSVEAALHSLELLGVRTSTWEVMSDQLWRV